MFRQRHWKCKILFLEEKMFDIVIALSPAALSCLVNYLELEEN